MKFSDLEGVILKFFHMWLAVLLMVCLAGRALAEDPVYFADLNLKVAVEKALAIYEPTATDMLGLTQLRVVNPEIRPDYSTTGITDLTGLEYASNLQELWLRVNLVSDISVLTGLTNLETVHLSRNRISDLSPLSGLSNLSYLDLHGNYDISDLSPLAGLENLLTLIIRQTNSDDLSALSSLRNLEVLHVSSNGLSGLSGLSELYNLTELLATYNEIDDLEDLSGLSNLETLDVAANLVSDLSPLLKLSRLVHLDVSYNNISDISGLLGLMNLQSLYLEQNPLSEEAYASGLQAIEDNSPNVYVRYDPNPRAVENISGSKGIYEDKIQITWAGVSNGPAYTSFYKVYRGHSLEDNAIPVSEWLTSLSYSDVTAEMGKTYFYWVDTAISERSTAKSKRSNVASGWLYNSRDILYVDDDAPGDPLPGDSRISDPNENGTPGHPYDTIQEAINQAKDGATVVVNEGIYLECVRFAGHNITVTGINLDDPDHPTPYPTIDANGVGTAVVFAQEETSDCLLQGFVITKGKDNIAAAISITNSSPTLRNCIVAGNKALDPNGGIIHCRDSNAIFLNCTICDNRTGDLGVGICLIDSDILFMNCIIHNDTPTELAVYHPSQVTVAYSNVSGHQEGGGNFDIEPNFVRRGYWDGADGVDMAWVPGDYHLSSQAGHWSSEYGEWVIDEQTCPSIDAGDPGMPFEFEPWPNGQRINIGAYGGTTQASLSP